MLNRLFKKTPTVEEFRQIVFDYLSSHKNLMPDNTKLLGENVNGFLYSQIWIWGNQKQKKIYEVWCDDIREYNSKFPNIKFEEITGYLN